MRSHREKENFRVLIKSPEKKRRENVPDLVVLVKYVGISAMQEIVAHIEDNNILH